MNPSDIAPAEWTSFVNLNADNSLEGTGKLDLKEMEAVGSIEGKFNVIALVDGGSEADAHGWQNGTRLMYVTRDPAKGQDIVSREIAVDPASDLGKLLAAGNGELDTGSPEVLHAALDYVQRNIPSKHFMLDLWDHGNGWRGISFDDHPNSSLDMPELQKALAGLPQKVDILSADACLMATVEVADTARSAGVDWLVGSEETEPFEGWNYTDFLTRVRNAFETSTDGTLGAKDISTVIAESYASGPVSNATVSVTDLSRLDRLNGQIDAFSDALLAAGGLQDAIVRAAYDAALRFADADQLDLGSFAKAVSATISDEPLKSAADALVAGLAAATTERGADPRFASATGLTLYAPRSPVSPEYAVPGAPWLGSRWNLVLASLTPHAPV